jgi:O-methyltransferase
MLVFKEIVKKLVPPLLVDMVRFMRKDKYKDLYSKYKIYSMIDEKTFIDNLKLSEYFSKQNNGCIVECGVWRGGMSAALAEICGVDRKYYLFDSFEGLPSAKEEDGKAAKEWQNDKHGPLYFNNCKAEIHYAEQAMSLSLASNYEIVKGWFSETLPNFNADEKISVLRLDGDWYGSTMECLTNLYEKIVPGGLIIVDDYYAWDGCTRAIHDFFSRNSLTDRIRQTQNGVCYILKAS